MTDWKPIRKLPCDQCGRQFLATTGFWNPQTAAQVCSMQCAKQQEDLFKELNGGFYFDKEQGNYNRN